jgi:hypothetical protein
MLSLTAPASAAEETYGEYFVRDAKGRGPGFKIDHCYDRTWAPGHPPRHANLRHTWVW